MTFVGNICPFIDRKGECVADLETVVLGHLALIARVFGDFRFHDAIVLGCCCGARTTTASLGMVNDCAKSKVPALGYPVPYAVSSTTLTIGGMVLVMLLA
jgi:uncharacterized transporter YbjL